MHELLNKIQLRFEKAQKMIQQNPADRYKIERQCKIDFIQFSFDSVDKETRWQFIHSTKSTEWFESLKLLKDQVLANIGASLRLKATKKNHKIIAKYNAKHKEKTNLNIFCEQLESKMPESIERIQAINAAKKSLEHIESELKEINTYINQIEL